MDHEQIVCNILVSLRGKLSQAHLSKKLGYKHNQIFKWETNERRIPWKAFTDLCHVRKIDLAKIIWTNFRFSGDVSDASKLLSYIIGNSEAKVISKTLGISKYRLSGWLTGKRKPYLDDILKILDVIEHRMTHFIVGILGEKKAEDIGIDLTSVKFEKFESRNPVFSAFLRIMETKIYSQTKKIEVGFFAKKLGISLEYEKSLLMEAVELGLLQESHGKYKANIVHTDLRDSNAVTQQRLYWCKEAIKRLESKKITAPESIFGNLIYSATNKEQNLIVERYLGFFNDVRSIINSNDQPEDVFVLNIQMIPVCRT